MSSPLTCELTRLGLVTASTAFRGKVVLMTHPTTPATLKYDFSRSLYTTASEEHLMLEWHLQYQT